MFSADFVTQEIRPAAGDCHAVAQQCPWAGHRAVGRRLATATKEEPRLHASVEPGFDVSYRPAGRTELDQLILEADLTADGQTLFILDTTRVADVGEHQRQTGHVTVDDVVQGVIHLVLTVPDAGSLTIRFLVPERGLQSPFEVARLVELEKR